MGNRTSNIIHEDSEIKKFSHFPPNDVREWATYFKLNYPSELLSITDLEEIFSIYFPNNISNIYYKEFSKQLFNTINISNSGNIDFNELLIAFSILTKGSKFEQIRWIFRFYDTDKDGLISKQEMKNSISNIYKMVYGANNEWEGEGEGEEEEGEEVNEKDDEEVNEEVNEKVDEEVNEEVNENVDEEVNKINENVDEEVNKVNKEVDGEIDEILNEIFINKKYLTFSDFEELCNKNKNCFKKISIFY